MFELIRLGRPIYVHPHDRHKPGSREAEVHLVQSKKNGSRIGEISLVKVLPIDYDRATWKSYDICHVQWLLVCQDT